MGLAFGAALVLIYMLVVMEFGNFRLPGIIMAPIPLTLIGIIPGHWLLGASFTATSMIGWIALAGIIVRNSILLVDFSKHAIADGMPVRQAVLEAVRTRTRPIVITSAALIAGSASIITDPIFQGMAISLLFGAVVSTALTLIVIPLACANATGAYRTAAGDAAMEAPGCEVPILSRNNADSKSSAGSAKSKIAAAAAGATEAIKSGAVASTVSRGQSFLSSLLQPINKGLTDAGEKFKDLANKPGYGWLQPIYLAGAFSAEAMRHLLGRAETPAITGGNKPAATKKKTARKTARKTAAAQSNLQPSPVARIVAPVKEALGHLLGKPAAFAPNGAHIRKSAKVTAPLRAAQAAKSKGSAKRPAATSKSRTTSVAKPNRSGKKAVGKTVAKSNTAPRKTGSAQKAITKRAARPAKAPGRSIAKAAKTPVAGRKAVAVTKPKTASKQAKSSTSAKAASPSRKTASMTPRKSTAKPAAKKTTVKTRLPKDDLQKINGIGPALVRKLNENGITRYEQIAQWKNSDVSQFDEMLNFKGRISRENWIGQAKALVRKAQMRAANEKLKAASKKKPLGTRRKKKSG